MAHLLYITCVIPIYTAYWTQFLCNRYLKRKKKKSNGLKMRLQLTVLKTPANVLLGMPDQDCLISTTTPFPEREF